MPDAPISETISLLLGQWDDNADPGFEALNLNWAKIDAAIMAVGDTRPAPYQVGKLFLDTTVPAIVQNTGTEDVPVWTDVLSLVGIPMASITGLVAALLAITTALDDKVDSTDERLTVVDDTHDGLHPQLDGNPNHIFHEDGTKHGVNTGRGWTIAGLLNVGANDEIPKWTARDNEHYTYADITIVGAPTGAPVTIDFIKTHLGSDSVAATLTLPAGDTFAFDDALDIDLVDGDTIVAAVTGVGSINQGTTAYIRLRQGA